MTNNKAMKTKAGVWIDHRRAVVVLISDSGEEIRTIESNAEKVLASAAGSGTKQPDRHEGSVPDNRQERKFMSELNTYYDEVLTCLHGADPVLILGPGEAKGEFQKRLESQKFPALVVELATADKLTDGQVADRVRQHFAK